MPLHLPSLFPPLPIWIPWICAGINVVHLILLKVCGNEKMWCEWCDKDICINIEYKEHVMESDGYSSFLERMALKYGTNLKAECPVMEKDLSSKRYVQKICFWHYEH